MKISAFEDHYIPEPMSGCWLWLGSRNKTGHATAGFQRKRIQAYRLAWLIAFGPIPDGAWVLHKCDTPACVNPDHLFLGNHQANVDDKVRKGRQARHWAKLTVKQVRSIKIMLAQGISQADLARRFSLSPSNISALASGAHWRDVK